MSRRRRRTVESEDESEEEESSMEEIETSQSLSPTRRRSTRLSRRNSYQNETDSDYEQDENDSDQQMSNNNFNHNHNSNNNNGNRNRNNNEEQSQVLYDEAKNEIEGDNCISSDDDNNDNNSDDNKDESENMHPNFSEILPRFINNLDKKFHKIDEDIEEIALTELIDTAQSIAEYNNKQNNYKKQKQNLKMAMNKLLESSKDIKIEKLMLRKISTDIRDENKLEDENNNNPIETGNWDSYLINARNNVLNELDGNGRNDSDMNEIKSFINNTMANYKVQFEDAIQVDDIEESDDDNNRNRNDENGSDEESDDDIIIDKSNKNNIGRTTCPLTTEQFKKPFKSKVCGHTFEKDAIFEYIEKKHRNRELVECPLMGCTHMLTKENMIRDIRTEKLIKAHSRAEQNQDSDEEAMFDLTVRD